MKEAFKSLENHVERLENQMSGCSEAIELIKTYGFQPNQFEELLKAHRGLQTADEETKESGGKVVKSTQS